MTYNWAGNCQDASLAISYSIDEPNSLQRLNFTFPSGEFESVTFDRNNYSDTAQLFMYSNSSSLSSANIPYGGTTYFALGILEGISISSNYDSALNNQPFTPGLLLDQGIWIGRVSCAPTLTWRIAESCTWDGSFMRNCTAASGENTTALDTRGLDALTEYMTAVQWQLYNDHNMFYTENPFPGIVPTLENFEGVTGVLAYSIVAVASNPSFGTVNVDTIGEPLHWVYVVRLHVPVIVFVMLTLSAMMAVGNMAHDVLNGTPLRKAKFFTIAGAVRGSWWDQQLSECGQVSQEKLRHVGSQKIKFVAGALVSFQEHGVEQGPTVRAELESPGRSERKPSVLCYELGRSECNKKLHV